MKHKFFFAVPACVLLVLFLFPEPRTMPVAGATAAAWHPDSFWYEPWGSSGVHKGIDIFAQKGTAVVGTTHLVVLFKGNLKKGGKVIVALGPKLRFHYYAHLHTLSDEAGLLILKGEPMGTVGDSGNAAGKPPHLHYSILSLLPRVWRIDASTQGYKKAFFIDPTQYLAKAGP